MSIGVRGGAVGGNRLADQLSQLGVAQVRGAEIMPPARATLLAVYDPDTLADYPPPQWVKDRISDDANRRLYAKVLIEGYEALGPQYIPFHCPPSDFFKEENGLNAVQRAETEFDLAVTIPAKNINAAYISGRYPKSVRTVRAGTETPEDAEPVALMSSTRVFDIIGV